MARPLPVRKMAHDPDANLTRESGIRHVGGANAKGMAQAAQTARPKVPMRRLGADCSVVAEKRGNARGAKGAGHRHLSRVNRQREEPDVQWEGGSLRAVARAG